MPQQIINLGATGSGAGGDSARTAFEKAIANFAELYIAALPGTAAQKAAARDMFGLGSAATRAAQTGPTDTTPGALMAVGAFGIGGQNPEYVTDLAALSYTRVFRWNIDTVGAPTGHGEGLYMSGATVEGGYGNAILLDYSSDTYWIARKTAGIWYPAVRLFHTGNILGTVSQSAGVPTGAIIERGSNANGEYVRFADGTQWARISANIRSSGDVSTPTQNYIPLPASFAGISGPARNCSVTVGIAYPTEHNSLAVLRCTGTCISNTQALVELATTPAQVLVIHLQVFGRWF